ncbi:hypothetical protein ATDW_26920 [Asticcacaulis sp. DW145]|jgi:hypothetical protein|uniref:DUF6334 family protein n=1 Tax=unclassified Asticcacaulis TaxID=2628350 RepID=UPI00308F3494|nr:hypothetical protein ATDW_26920 [Asticcacaulis sp. DW145]
MRRLDWEVFQGRRIQAIYGYFDDQSVPDARPDRIVFACDGVGLSMSVDADTDQLILETTALESSSQCHPVPALDFCIGQEFGWAWFAENYLGYNDLFLIGFSKSGQPGEALTPAIGFIGEGSVIGILRLSPLL